MPLDWSTDRRQLLKAGGLIAGLAAAPRFAFAADGDTLKIRVDADLQVLDPAFMIGNLDEIMMRCIYVSLTRLGDISAFGKWSLYGAETLDIKSPTEIHFTLIPGLKWTGGFGAVTAEDVKFSFERIANPATASPWAFQFEKLDKVEVVDERKGIIRLKSAYQPFFVASIPYYGGHIISKAATEKAGGKFTTEPPAQCGAMLIDKWEPQQRILLKANPDWPGPKPAFDKIEIAIVTDDQVALLNYKAGSYDYCRVDPSAVVALKKELPPATTLIEAQSTRYVWLTINQLSPKLADAKVRAALQTRDRRRPGDRRRLRRPRPALDRRRPADFGVRPQGQQDSRRRRGQGAGAARRGRRQRSRTEARLPQRLPLDRGCPDHPGFR